MTILILMPDRNVSEVVQALNVIDTDLEVRVWPDTGDKSDIEFVIVWDHPTGELKKYPNLKVIASFGAGVDHIFKDTDLPKQVPITKIVDKNLTRQMCEYVAGVIFNHRLRLTEYSEFQAAAIWAPKEARQGNNVCLLGLGNIGRCAAEYLTVLGFSVSGWSQSRKDIENVTTFHGEKSLGKAISDADYIVCLLPLTPNTENILDKTLFSKARKGAYLINVGRGGHLNEDDLLEALYQGQMSGACLDVFRTEPLPDDHPFWRHPKIHLTPHTASLTDIDQAATQFYENYQNMKDNRPLINQVDVTKGY